MQPVLMYIETAIPKNITAALCRHHPSQMVSRLAHSVVSHGLDLWCNAIAIDVFYSKMHHMYLFIMNIEKAIPKNIYAPCVTHRVTQRPPWQSQQTQFLLIPVFTAFLLL